MKQLLLLLVVASLFSCQSTGLKIGNLDIGKLVNQGVQLWDANNVTQEKEIQFGQNMSAVLLGARQLHDNAAINQYVSNVGLWLAMNSTRPDLPWRFGVINSDAINAFAAPGGFVFITSGMLLQFDNEAQLAAVLAHEIIHVVEQHHLTALKEGALRSAVTETLFVSVDAYQGNTDASQQDQNYKGWAKQVTGAAQDLYSKGLNREDEFSADQQGIRLLTQSGYDPFSFITNLQILAAISPDDTSLALMYKTHPTPDERLLMLENQVEELATYSGQELASRFEKNVGKLFTN